MFIKEKDPQSIELHVSLNQLKTLYISLFRRLHDLTPEEFDELDEDDMLTTLQTYLQKRAAEAGFDGTNHAEWEAFLGMRGMPSCEQRFANRNPSPPDKNP